MQGLGTLLFTFEIPSNRVTNASLARECDSVKLKHRIVFEILLVIAAIAVFIYNFSMQREIAYIASIVAVCGTITFLVRDIVKLKKASKFQYVENDGGSF